MYTNLKYKSQIVIELEPGIYTFEMESSTGKTRLCKELKKLQAYGEPVIGYTYNDKLSGISLEDMLKRNKCKVLMLDRYDMYEGDYADIINSVADSTIVMVDCKGEFTVTNKDIPCYISMTVDKIEVTE